MTDLGRLLLAALLLGLLLRDLLRSWPAPRRRLGPLFIERNRTGAEAGNGTEVGRRDTEAVGPREEDGHARVPLAGLAFAEETLGTPSFNSPLDGEPRQMAGGPYVCADEFQEAFGVHPRDFAISSRIELPHDRAWFSFDERESWRCTSARMGGFPP